MSPPAPATVLILGGTGEARALAGQVAGLPGVRVVSSLAGRVRDPALPAGEVRIGGFGGVDGLAGWLTAQRVTALVDATHPFAQSISANAAGACEQTGTPLLSLVRPPWTAGPGDRWHPADSLPAAAALVPSLGRRAFLTTGRQGLDSFAAVPGVWFLIRCVDPPTGPVPPSGQVLLARGPYHADAERELMRRHQIDVLLTKNSGGELTEGKLSAARGLGLPVIMVRRPLLPAVPRVQTVTEARTWLLQRVP